MNAYAMYPRSRIPLWAGVTLGVLGVSFIGLTAAVLVVSIRTQHVMTAIAAVPPPAAPALAPAPVAPQAAPAMAPAPALVAAAATAREAPAAPVHVTAKKHPRKHHRAVAAAAASHKTVAAGGGARPKSHKKDDLASLLGM